MLEAKELSVAYGRHQALDHVSVNVEPGEICVVLGANGAGKSTLLNTIAGIVRPGAGAVEVDHVALNGASTDQIVERGIALVPEGHRIFGDLTVRENLQLGAYPKRARGQADETMERVFRLFPKLKERQPQIARTMSGGERQMVAVGRALMSRPDILMLDEPSLGLSPLVSGELFRALREIGETGVGILLVEQNARKSLEIADRGYVLENGRVTHKDAAGSLARDPAVREAYLGGRERDGRRVHAVGALPAAPVVVAAPAGAMTTGALAAALAERAERVHQEFLLSRSAGSDLPAAFRKAREKSVSEKNVSELQGSELGRMAASFAERAERIWADHVRERGRAMPRPAESGRPAPAPASAPAATELGGSDLGRMAAAFAARATEIHEQHIAARRVRRDA